MLPRIESKQGLEYEAKFFNIYFFSDFDYFAESHGPAYREEDDCKTCHCCTKSIHCGCYGFLFSPHSYHSHFLHSKIELLIIVILNSRLDLNEIIQLRTSVVIVVPMSFITSRIVVSVIFYCIPTRSAITKSSVRIVIVLIASSIMT